MKKGIHKLFSVTSRSVNNYSREKGEIKTIVGMFNIFDIINPYLK